MRYSLDGRVIPTINGGKGSGNWGHKGRPGKVGGSGKGSFVDSLAKESLAEAKKQEKATTSDMKSITKGAGGYMEGLEFKLKGEDSLKRKILTDAKENSPISKEKLEEANKGIHDNLRYTTILKDSEFKSGFDKMKKDLEAKGYKFMKIKNTMADVSGGYRGINTQIKNPEGYIFELQFHTKESFDAKMVVHKDYEIARDPKRPLVKRRAAEKRMAKLYKSLKTPNGVEKIKSIDKFKNMLDFLTEVCYNCIVKEERSM